MTLATFQQCSVPLSKQVHLAGGLKRGTKTTHRQGTTVITHQEIRMLMQQFHSHVITENGRNTSQHSRCHTVGCCKGEVMSYCDRFRHDGLKERPWNGIQPVEPNII